MRLLIIEDEVKTASNLKMGFEENQFLVDVAFDGETGYLLATRNNYDLIITDIIMPGINGYEVCRRIREAGINTPMIMLTALGMTSDKITGFNAGTDDYVVKPTDFEELLARTKTLIKRSKNIIQVDNKLIISDLVMNLDKQEVTRGGNLIELTPKEFALLQFLIKNKGKVKSKSEISEKVWNINFDTGTNVVEVYVNYLRNKIDRNFPIKLIHTKTGRGYYIKEQT